MKTFGKILTLFLLCSVISFAQDKIPGNRKIVIPVHIQSIYNQIKIAEDNGNWNAYYQLRNQIISEWQQINPNIANLYRNVSDAKPDLTPDGMAVDRPYINTGEQTRDVLFETPYNRQSKVLWGNDMMITGSTAYDISMDISRDGEIYIAVVGRLDGSSTRDSTYIYKSTDGGETWSMWSSIYTGAHLFKQVELMCFDGYSGSTGDSYILLFYLFDDGWLRVGRTETATPFWNYYTISGTSGSGFPTDFAVDRNYPSTNYRVFCVYDSLNWIKSIRSDPASYGTVWQDAAFVGSATVGRDVDLCYGINGAVYVSFNGFNSGNLYAIENDNYADPASWGTINTLVTGSTDTTRHAEVISSRDAIPNNIAAVVFELKSGSSYDLYSVMKPSGSSTWETMQSWVVPDENKWPSLYSSKINGNRVFRTVFERSGEGNVTPRNIRYKYYDGTIWQQSEVVSDSVNDVTGLQKPEVGDLDGNTPVFAYVGANYIGVYFDNYNWTLLSSITVTSPNGGEIWDVGTSENITWTSTGITNVRIELSINNGTNWSDIIASTPSTGTYSWVVTNTPSTQCLIRISDASNPSTNDISDGVFTIHLPNDVKEELSGIPDCYNLFQNYPNPFNPTTKIKWQSPVAGRQTLKVYNVLGKEVATLVNEYKTAGRYEIEFNTDNLPSGVYLYRINVAPDGGQAGNYTAVKKMILMK